MLVFRGVHQMVKFEVVLSLKYPENILHKWRMQEHSLHDVAQTQNDVNINWKLISIHIIHQITIITSFKFGLLQFGTSKLWRLFLRFHVQEDGGISGFHNDFSLPPPETNSSHLKKSRNPKGSKRKLVSQPPFFSGYVSFRECNTHGKQ